MSELEDCRAEIDEVGDFYLVARLPPAVRVVLGRIRKALLALDRRLDRAAVRFRDLDDRLDAAAEVTLRIRVVPVLADLPDDAKATEWFRVASTPAAVYVGNGPGRPLSKFTTTAL